MIVHNHLSLLAFNTFGIDVNASQMIDCATTSEVVEAVSRLASKPMLVLGGGSNVLFMEDFEGTIVRPLITDFQILKETDTRVEVRVGAGVEWNSFVSECVARGWQGVENLTAIPGNVGASPVQNIGAYGAEAKDTIVRVEGILASGKPFCYQNTDCAFGYRTSIFKTSLRGQAVITHVVFCLQKTTEAPLLDYGPVREAVAALGAATIGNVSKAIAQIRAQKLPDPKTEGNAGSFFKNPEVDFAVAEKLKAQYAQMPAFALPNGRTKLSAAWLIDQCGWKGKTLDRAGVHSRQPLVLVNRGDATGHDVMNLSYAIQRSVQEQFGVEIVPEVNQIWRNRF